MKNTTISEYNVNTISAADTYAVRHPVLRKGQPLEHCRFDGDNESTTFHLGVSDNTKLIGVATFLKAKHHFFEEPYQYQLRGMAILEAYQGRRIGDLLLKYGEDHLKTLDIQLLWFNARQIAWNFYNRNGYKAIGSSFDIGTIGLHKVMFKKL